MNKVELLERLGLSNKESSIYLSLSESGPATVSEISKNTGLHRPTVYQTLPALQKLGLVTESKKGKRAYFVAESPEKLRTLLSETESKLNELVPELKAVFESHEQKPLVKFLEGKKGITFVFEDLVTTLKRGDVFYRYSSARNQSRADSYLPKNYRALRDQKQLERFVITSETSAKQKTARLERAIKTVPKEFGLFDFNVTQVIYGNKVAFIDYNSETALIIENPVVADFQRKLFQILFQKL